MCLGTRLTHVLPHLRTLGTRGPHLCPQVAYRAEPTMLVVKWGDLLPKDTEDMVSPLTEAKVSALSSIGEMHDEWSDKKRQESVQMAFANWMSEQKQQRIKAGHVAQSYSPEEKMVCICFFCI